MISHKSCLLTAVVALAAMTQSAQAATAFLTFDNFPTGQSTFSAAGLEQTIVYPEATFSGGVILGNPTSFPAQSFATSPNVYGTASFNFGGQLLSETLTIALSPSFVTNEVSFPLFNGLTTTQSYTATAFNAAHNSIASQSLNLVGNISSGFGIIDLNALGIASVTISPDGSPSSFDFIIDSVALNQSVQNVNTVPLPAALPLFVGGLGMLSIVARSRKRKHAKVAAA
jgi:hypothetical protein